MTAFEAGFPPTETCRQKSVEKMRKAALSRGKTIEKTVVFG